MSSADKWYVWHRQKRAIKHSDSKISIAHSISLRIIKSMDFRWSQYWFSNDLEVWSFHWWFRKPYLSTIGLCRQSKSNLEGAGATALPNYFWQSVAFDLIWRDLTVFCFPSVWNLLCAWEKKYCFMIQACSNDFFLKFHCT